MAFPLALNVDIMMWTLQEAAAAEGGTSQQAKLCFAHAETVVPIACLLGLFKPQQPKPLLTQPTSALQCSVNL